MRELPYQVNQAARLIERIAELVKDSKMEGISDIRGRVRPGRPPGGHHAPEKDELPQPILNQLYIHTNMQVTLASTWWPSSITGRNS